MMSRSTSRSNRRLTNLLGVTDVRFDFLDQFRRHLPNAVFLGVLASFLKYFFYRFTPYDVLAPTRRVYLGAFQNLCLGLASLIHFSSAYREHPILNC